MTIVPNRNVVICFVRKWAANNNPKRGNLSEGKVKQTELNGDSWKLEAGSGRVLMQGGFVCISSCYCSNNYGIMEYDNFMKANTQKTGKGQQ